MIQSLNMRGDVSSTLGLKGYHVDIVGKLSNTL